MAEPKYPRSNRTIFPRHQRPMLVGEHLRKAKEREAERKKYDPMYMTADEARALPPEAADNPDIRARVDYSRHDWPENHANATTALGPLKTGAGETVEQRTLSAEEIFHGRPIGGADEEQEK